MEEVFAAAFPRPRGGADGRLAGGLSLADATAIAALAADRQAAALKVARIAHIASASSLRVYKDQRELNKRLAENLAQITAARDAATRTIEDLQKQLDDAEAAATAAQGDETKTAEIVEKLDMVALALLAATVYDIYSSTIIDLHAAANEAIVSPSPIQTFNTAAISITDRAHTAANQIKENYLSVVGELINSPAYRTKMQTLRATSTTDAIIAWCVTQNAISRSTPHENFATTITKLRSTIPAAGPAAADLNAGATGGDGSGGGDAGSPSIPGDQQGNPMTPGGDGIE